MREYFNMEERENHIKVTSCQVYVKKLAESPAITEEERKDLLKAFKLLDKVTDSIFERFGEAYIRKLKGIMACNTLKIVGKYAPMQNAISHVAQVDMLPMIRKLQMWTCLDCERTGHKDCPMYNMGIACELEDVAEEGCPFRL
jgi:hypothetical protein